MEKAPPPPVSAAPASDATTPPPIEDTLRMIEKVRGELIKIASHTSPTETADTPKMHKIYTELARKITTPFFQALARPDHHKWPTTTTTITSSEVVDPASSSSFSPSNLPALPVFCLDELDDFDIYVSSTEAHIKKMLIAFATVQYHIAELQSEYLELLKTALDSSKYSNLTEDQSGYLIASIIMFHEMTSGILKPNCEEIMNVQKGVFTVAFGDHVQKETAEHLSDAGSTYLFRTKTHCSSCKSPKLPVIGRSLISKAPVCIRCIVKEARFLRTNKKTDPTSLDQKKEEEEIVDKVMGA